MKVSLNWIRMLNEQYKCAADPAPDGIEALVEKIGAQLGAVEKVVNLGERYKGIVVAKVISAEKHPGADKLKVCRIDDGGAVKGAARDEKGRVQVVCGANNVAAGQLVAWLPPGSTVPATFDKNPLVLEAREIRGQLSNGMIASAKELAIGDSHEGILVIDEPAKPGDDFAKVYELDDYIIDIENKMFTHRPDLFGQLGVAREIAGIQGHTFVSPPIYKAAKTTGKIIKDKLPLQLKNEVPELVPRFVAQVFRNIKVAPSPVWLQSYLARVSIRPINNIVDITNYFMMLTGQPLHAYDYDKLKTGVLGVRLSRKGEKLSLLNGKEITLDSGAVVITDGHRPIGLGGVMGGADTEVDENTKNIILECATFDMNLTRKVAMAYGLFTDAATRFTKNQSPRQNDRVTAWAAGEIIHLAGGAPDGTIHDVKSGLKANPAISVSADFINRRLGTDLTAAQMKKLLQNVEFETGLAGDRLSVTAPFWRTDIEIPEDIVEEVGRLRGYDKLPAELPKRSIEPAARNELLEFKDRLRGILAGFGANEALTYSFVHDDLLKKTGQDSRLAYRLSNALSPALQYYRFNLLPSLLEKVHPNIKAGYDKFALFEIGKGHDREHKDKDGLPQEFELLTMVYTAASKTRPAGAAYYQAKEYLVQMAAEVGVGLKFTALKELPKAPLAQAYEVSRTAFVSTSGDKFLGIIGELKTGVRYSLRLPEHTAGFEIDIEALLSAKPAHKNYRPLNRFPELEQDFCLRSAAKLSYQELMDFVTENLEKLSKDHGYEFSLEPIDIFQKTGDESHKQTTWRIILWHPKRTLTTAETNKLLDELAGRAKKELKAERV